MDLIELKEKINTVIVEEEKLSMKGKSIDEQNALAEMAAFIMKRIDWEFKEYMKRKEDDLK